jgi:hypothetical protein
MLEDAARVVQVTLINLRSFYISYQFSSYLVLGNNTSVTPLESTAGGVKRSTTRTRTWEKVDANAAMLQRTRETADCT